MTATVTRDSKHHSALFLDVFHALPFLVSVVVILYFASIIKEIK